MDRENGEEGRQGGRVEGWKGGSERGSENIPLRVTQRSLGYGQICDICLAIAFYPVSPVCEGLAGVD